MLRVSAQTRVRGVLLLPYAGRGGVWLCRIWGQGTREPEAQETHAVVGPEVLDGKPSRMGLIQVMKDGAHPGQGWGPCRSQRDKGVQQYRYAVEEAYKASTCRT